MVTPPPDPGPHRPGAGAVVGRDAELAAVAAAIEADGTVVVVGEAGIGKTTLVREAARAAGRTLREGGAFSTLAWMPYFALERATGLHLRGDADWVADAVEGIVGPDVLFVDDAQWADDGTLGAVERLAGRVALVVAARPGAERADAAIETLRTSGARVMDLEPLSSDDATRLALERRPGLSGERAASIARRAGGNPFVIEELAATGEPAAGLRRAIAARVDEVGTEARGTLEVLAVAQRPMPPEALHGVPELVRRGLAVAGPDGDVRIRHPLLAEVVVAGIDPAAAATIHRRIAALVTSDGERARHLAAAGDRAAAHALALRALAVAQSPGERAAHLGIAAETAAGLEANDLRIEAARSLRLAGELDAAVAALDALVDPDPETLALAEATRARVRWSSGDPDGMRSAIDRGLALVAGHRSPAEAALRAEAVTVTALVDGRFEEGLTDAEAAIRLARDVGADPLRAMLLRATILTGLGRPGWDAALGEVVETARAAGDVDIELSAANNLVSGHEMHGQPNDGSVIATAMLERAATLHLAGWERQFGALIANLDLHAGRLHDALRRSEELLEGPLDPLATQQVGLTAALADVDLGRHEDAAPLLERLLQAAAPDVTGRGDVLFVLAEASLWGGQPDQALAHLDDYRAYAESEYPTSFLVDVTAGWAATDAGRPIPPRLAIGEASGMLIGARLEREALEMLNQDRGRAAATFDAAGTAYVGFHRRGELRTRWAAAEARRQAGDEAATRQALDALGSLEHELAADGFVPLLGRVHRSLRLLGVRRAERGPATDLPSRLTAREREIAALVGQGLTNPEIARRMGLGRPTVARLLSNAMLKLGVDSRSQLAARHAELA